MLLSRENNDLGSLDFEEDWRNYFTVMALVIVNLMHRIHMWVYFYVRRMNNTPDTLNNFKISVNISIGLKIDGS